ncbi:MAG: hypothetical protein J6U54_14645 [Clostridiales bacterium]|nr:hypothetical protein [Clostridiales bacterium]
MIFFTADTHFGDDETIERESRPFRDLSEFEEVFISNVNSVATENDVLYALGDWINYNDRHHPDIREASEITKRLNPDVILIMGNDEDRILNEVYGGDFEKMRSDLIEYGFAEVYKETDIEISGIQLHLIHDPIDHKKDVLNLFGHTHRGTGLWKPFGLNVGLDLNHFRPFSENDILKLLKTKRDWWDKDPSVWCM